MGKLMKSYAERSGLQVGHCTAVMLVTLTDCSLYLGYFAAIHLRRAPHHRV